jgi:hypothetical protein
VSQQYLRRVKLLVGGSDQAGTDPTAGLDLSDMHIVFEVENGAVGGMLKHARVNVFNLKDETANTIQKEFTRVELSAGYGDDEPALIFQGSICIVRHGKLNATDTFLEIVAQDSDSAYNFATSNRTLATGWTPDQLHAALLQDLAPFGIGAGNKPVFTTEAAARGKVCYGMTRDFLSTLAAQQGCDWNIEDGKLNFIPQTGVLPGEAFVLTTDSGLIGTPCQTTGGIEIRCLLNPRIRAGGQVKIDNASLATTNLRTVPLGQSPGQVVAGKDTDGAYKALVVRHEGDTRGQQWYTSMICLAVDPTAAVPLGGPTLVAVPET